MSNNKDSKEKKVDSGAEVKSTSKSTTTSKSTSTEAIEQASTSKIDYFQVVKDSFNFIWNYKILWLFGLIMALFQGNRSSSGSFNFSSNYSDVGNSSNWNEVMDQFANGDWSEITDQTSGVGTSQLTDQLERIADLPMFDYSWILILLFSIIGLVLALVFWYLSNVARAALIKAVVFNQNGQTESITFKSLWNSAHKHILDIFVFQIIMFLLTIPIAIIFVVIVLLPSIICPFLCCLSIPFSILWFVALVLFNIIALRFIVLEDKSGIDAIQASWQFMVNKLRTVTLAGLVGLLVGSGFWIVKAIIGLILGALMFLPVLGIGASTGAALSAFEAGNPPDLSSMLLLGSGFTVGILILALASKLIMALVEAPYLSFISVYWTNIFMKLSNEDK
jgi:hypothetical protein